MQDKPKIFIFTGTSGAGRKTIARSAAQSLGLIHVPSYTTRIRRAKEINDSHYIYINEEQFIESAARKEFVQTAHIHQHWYGTKRKDLYDCLDRGKDVYLVLNRQGTEDIISEFGGQVIRIFIYVSKQTLTERLESKGFNVELIDQYVQDYADEVTYRKSCEHVFENLKLQQTIDHVTQFLKHRYF